LEGEAGPVNLGEGLDQPV